MKKVASADSLITINHYRNLLQSEGISAIIRNEHLGAVLGEMPFTEVWPQLWVTNDLDHDRALELINDAITDESPTTPWHCSKCGEKNEGQFSACWNCGTADLPRDD
jgi:hypothetical protein